MKDILVNYWHPVEEEKKIQNKPTAITLLGEKLVLYMYNGQPVVFKDLCIHRGAQLSGGTIDDSGSIQCPYHGWKFNSDGNCISIPSMETSKKIPSSWCVKKYKAKIAFNLIWVNLGENPETFPNWPSDAWNDDNFKVFLVNTYEWKSSAGRIAENAIDFSHFNFVHKGYTELADGPLIKNHDVNTNGDQIHYEYYDSKLLRRYRIDFPFTVHDSKKVVNINNEHKTWSERGDSKEGDTTILSFIASPTDSNNSKIFVFMARNYKLDEPNTIFIEGFDEIMEQDRKIVESQKPENIPLHIRAEVNVNVPDAASLQYRKLFVDKIKNKTIKLESFDNLFVTNC